MKKYLYITLGCLMFGLGTLGIFLPILPTTIFYLLTGYFWLRSSERLHQKFIQSEKYHKYVEDPLIHKNISTKKMILMFIGMAIVFAIPGLLVQNDLMRISLLVVYFTHVIGLTWHLKFRATKKVGESIDR